MEIETLAVDLFISFVIGLFSFAGSPPPVDGPRVLPMQLEAAGETLPLSGPVYFNNGMTPEMLKTVFATLQEEDAVRLFQFYVRHKGEHVKYIVCDTVVNAPLVLNPVYGEVMLITRANQNDRIQGFLDRGCP